jgi:hypothetical protein
MIRVYHAIKPTFGMSGTPAQVKLDEFKHVANVDTADLDVAYERTNHIDQPWWENKGVLALGERCHRSTSVGDVMENAETGVLSMVASFGFTIVGRE